MSKTKIIAHRGASGYAPENTIAAFKKAIEMKADGIELDVHLTKDGRLAVVHDEKLGRTSNGKGLIMDYTFEELRMLDFGSWYSPEYENERIPALEEVMELTEGWHGILNIEIKAVPRLFKNGIEDNVISIIKNYNRESNVIVSSFNHDILARIKNKAPEIKVGILYSHVLASPWKYAVDIGAYAIHPEFKTVTAETVACCHKYNIAVNCWTVNNPDDIKLMASMNVDNIITNYPDIARNLL